MKTLQRIYQITPIDEAMKVLLDHGFRSALRRDRDAARQVPGPPRRRFSTDGRGHAGLRKAQQVSSVTLAVFGAAKQLRSSPPVFALSGPAPGRGRRPRPS